MEIYNFNKFDESYLESNFAPLYHYTTTWGFYDIITSNTLKRSKIKHPFFGDDIEIVSLTRNKNLNFDYFKFFIDVVIEFDATRLKSKYKIQPYDFFIHTNKEKYPKSNLGRENPFEFEETITSDIENVIEYIVSIDFRGESIFDRQVASLIPLLRSENKIIYINGKIY